MSKKVLLYSDLHIREETIDTCEAVLEQIGKIAIEKNVGYIINGGDTFNTRGLINTSCLDSLYRSYKEWAELGLKQIIIVGNHDQEDKKGKIHPMKVFESFAGWHVVDKPMIIPTYKNTLFCPYMSKSDIREFLLVEHKREDWRSWDAFVHWGVLGAKRNDSNSDTDGVDTEWLESFKNVFSGHYHLRNSIQNVHYIGSPYQQNFGEMGQPKGVIIYDREKNTKEFIEITGTPKHYEVAIEWNDEGKRIIKGDIKKISAIDHTRFKIFGDSEQCSKISSSGLESIIKCSSIKVERFVREKFVSRLNITSDEVLSPRTLVEKYIGFADTTLDRKRLMKVGLEILG